MKKLYLYIAGGVCSLLNFVFMALTGVKFKVSIYSTTTSIYSLLGDDGGDAKIIYIMILILTIFALAASVLAILCELGKLKVNKKIFVFIALGCLAVTAVLLFISKILFCSMNSVGDASSYFSLGIGAILGGIFNIIGAGAFGASIVLKK